MGINFRVNEKRGFIKIGGQNGTNFGSEEFSLTLVKWEGEKGPPVNLAWGPRWLNPALYATNDGWLYKKELSAKINYITVHTETKLF